MRHARTLVCALLHVTLLPQTTLRYLWSVAQYGATKFSSSNGVDYYARLFALELVALVMCAGSSQPQAFLTADGVVAGC